MDPHKSNFKGKLLEFCQKNRTSASLPVFKCEQVKKASDLKTGFKCKVTMTINMKEISAEGNVCDTKVLAEQSACCQLLPILSGLRSGSQNSDALSTSYAPKTLHQTNKPHPIVSESQLSSACLLDNDADLEESKKRKFSNASVESDQDDLINWKGLILEKCQSDADIYPVPSLCVERVESGFKATVDVVINGVKRSCVSDVYTKKRKAEREAYRLIYQRFYTDSSPNEFVNIVTDETGAQIGEYVITSSSSSTTADTKSTNTSILPLGMTHKSFLLSVCQLKGIQMSYTTTSVDMIHTCVLTMTVQGAPQIFTSDPKSNKKSAEDNACYLALEYLAQHGYVDHPTNTHVAVDESKLHTQLTESKNWKGELLESATKFKFSVKFEDVNRFDGFKCILRISIEGFGELNIKTDELLFESDMFASKKLAHQNASMKAMNQIFSLDFRFDIVKLIAANRVEQGSAPLYGLVYCSCGMTIGPISDFMIIVQNGIEAYFTVKPCALNAYKVLDNKDEDSSSNSNDRQPSTRTCDVQVIAQSTEASNPGLRDAIEKSMKEPPLRYVKLAKGEYSQSLHKIVCRTCEAKLGEEVKCLEGWESLGPLSLFFRDKVEVFDKSLKRSKLWLEDCLRKDFAIVEKKFSEGLKQKLKDAGLDV